MPILRPRAAFAPGISLRALGTAELFVVCTTRLWIAERGGSQGGGMDWRGGYALARISAEGAASFDALLSTAFAGAQRRLDFRPLRCPRLGADEAGLIEMIAALQRDHLVGAAAILGDWLPPAAVRLAFGPAQRLAAALARRELRVAYRPAVVCAFEAEPPMAAPFASMRLH